MSNHGHGASKLSHDFKAANHEGIDTKAMVLKKDPGVDVPTPQMMQSLKTLVTERVFDRLERRW